MTQEEKNLLLKDLCCRLPYGVKIHKALYGATTLSERDIESFRKGIDDMLMPYLRPMSSMTEEEQKEFVGFHCVTLCPIIMKDCLTIENEGNMFDWLNAHHFDYRNLIERGLAIKVTKENNPYKD